MLQLARGSRRNPGDRPRAGRAAPRRGLALIERSWPTLLLLGACVGLAIANALRAPAVAVGVLVATAIVAASLPRARLPACALALLLAGWWWGSVRLDALESSVLVPRSVARRPSRPS